MLRFRAKAQGPSQQNQVLVLRPFEGRTKPFKLREASPHPVVPDPGKATGMSEAVMSPRSKDQDPQLRLHFTQ